MVYRPYEAGDGDPNYDTINMDKILNTKRRTPFAVTTSRAMETESEISGPVNQCFALGWSKYFCNNICHKETSVASFYLVGYGRHRTPLAGNELGDRHGGAFRGIIKTRERLREVKGSPARRSAVKHIDRIDDICRQRAIAPRKIRQR